MPFERYPYAVSVFFPVMYYVTIVKLIQLYDPQGPCNEMNLLQWYKISFLKNLVMLIGKWVNVSFDFSFLTDNVFRHRHCLIVLLLYVSL